MKIKNGFMLRNVADTNVVVPVAQNALNYKGMLSLNETGAFLWKALEEETGREALVEAMLKEYDTDRETAVSDIDAFLDRVRAYGALEEES